MFSFLFVFFLGQCGRCRGQGLRLSARPAVSQQPDSSRARLGFSTGTARRAPGGRSRFTPPCPWHRGSGSTLAASKLCLSPSAPPCFFNVAPQRFGRMIGVVAAAAAFGAGWWLGVGGREEEGGGVISRRRCSFGAPVVSECQ